MNRIVLLGATALLAACPSEGPVVNDDDVVADDDDTVEPTPQTLPDSLDVEVLVVRDGAPLAGASVLQGGGIIQSTTDAAGRATVTVDTTVNGESWVIAAMPEHRSKGFEVDEVPEGPVEIELARIQIDNPDYTYGDPGFGDGSSATQCYHCHVRMIEQFENTAHRTSASNPRLHDVYSGTAHALTGQACLDAGGTLATGTLPGSGEGERCYIGDGLLPDANDCVGPCDAPAANPTNVGTCGDCHAPAVGGPEGGGHAMHTVSGAAYDQGVTCDFCHKVVDVDPDGAPGIGGRLVLGRPLEDTTIGVVDYQPLMYGRLPDVVNIIMGGVYTPDFGDASFCAGCHLLDQAPVWDDPSLRLDDTRWPDGRLPIHSTYPEWATSDYAPATECSVCHMPSYEAANAADLDLLESLEPGGVTGFSRSPLQLKSHTFQGPLEEPETGRRLLDAAVRLTLDVERDGEVLTVTTEVENRGAGHAVPTGEPMRSLLLTLTADCDGALKQLSGPTITDVGGEHARGVVGTDVTVDGTTLTWTHGTDDGDIVVLLRPTGGWMDYTGFGPFGDGTFPANAKGLPEYTLIDSIELVSRSTDTLELAEELTVQSGDHVVLSDAFVAPVEGAAITARAGHPGFDFARVLMDADGSRHVPHYRAVDVVRDNRILPRAVAGTTHTFVVPSGCGDATVDAAVVYRRFPYGLARERGWNAREYVADVETVTIGE